MDDHQSQLVEALKDRVIVSTCDGLLQALEKPAPVVVSSERRGEGVSFHRSIDELMGYA